MKHFWKLYLSTFCAYALVLTFPLWSTSCAPVPTSLSATGRMVYRADEAVIMLGALQHAAIELNQTSDCVSGQECKPLLSERDTRVIVNVVTPTLKALDALPNGWLPVFQASIQQITEQLDAEGRERLRPYLLAASVAAGIALQMRGGK